MSSLGLYFHIPFCARRCDYCDFFVVTDPRASADFFTWLARDLAGAARQLAGSALTVDSIYVGGGTPSMVAAPEIASILEACARLFTVDRRAEVTLEANPEGVTSEKLIAWRRAGINRLSLGVQSFTDAVLAPRGRAYSGAEAAAAYRAARDHGYDNVGVDLIAGLPGETVESFRDGIGRLLELAPDHVSVYLLETEESGKRTALAKAVGEGRERLAGDEEMVAIYTQTAEALEVHGYRHYEISNFARPGRASRHNLKYWRSEPWIGLGPSAHSYVGGRRLARPSDLRLWIDRVRSETVGEDYTLPGPEQRAREALVLELRLLEGVELSAFCRTWGFDPAGALAGEIAELREAGLLATGGGRLALTRRGLLLSNEVFSRLT